jgi:hypothetical protein
MLPSHLNTRQSVLPTICTTQQVLLLQPRIILKMSHNHDGAITITITIINTITITQRRTWGSWVQLLILFLPRSCDRPCKFYCNCCVFVVLSIWAVVITRPRSRISWCFGPSIISRLNCTLFDLKGSIWVSCVEFDVGCCVLSWLFIVKELANLNC